MADEPQERPAGAAFFDLDKTLIAGSSAMPFARAARAHGLITRWQMIGWARDHFRYRLKGATDEETSQVLTAARESIMGSRREMIERMWPEILAEVLTRIYPQVLAEVHRHQDEGRPTYIVSAAASGMVEFLAGILGMDGGIGTRYMVVDGRYTGELDGPFVYGPGKVTEMERIATGRGIDLAESWGYSDSASDLPMLEAVGHAVTVNPDARLTEVARARGWEVMRFDRLGRNLAIGAVLSVAVLAGMITGTLNRSAVSRPKRIS